MASAGSSASSSSFVCWRWRRFSSCLVRRREGGSANRRLCWVVVALVSLTIVFAYSGFRNQGGFLTEFVNHAGVMSNSMSQQRVSRGQHSHSKGETHGLAPSDETKGTNTVPENAAPKSSDDPTAGKSVHVLDPTGDKSGQKIEQPQEKPDNKLEQLFDVKGVLIQNSPGASKKQESDSVDNVRTNTGNNVASSNKGLPVSALNGSSTGTRFQCPKGFEITDSDNEWFRSSIVQKSQRHNVTDDDVDDVVILTPISNVKRHLRKYFENICSLTYPHQHISLVLGEDSSSDQTLEAAEELADEVRPYFKRVQVLRLKGSSPRTSGHARHEMSWQLTRRQHLAMARNQLLFGALKGERWVLWIDSDVRHIPSDLVERLLWPAKSIVAANCLYRMDSGQTDTFDRNTWRDTEASKKRLRGMPEDFLMLEGYEPTQRKFLNDLKEEGDVVRLDGVGGCVLLVEADAHRKGLVFPSFIFEHHVETEGLAKMAARMGIEMYGLPSVNVIHW